LHRSSTRIEKKAVSTKVLPEWDRKAGEKLPDG